jgi:hypothetical protein
MNACQPAPRRRTRPVRSRAWRPLQPHSLGTPAEERGFSKRSKEEGKSVGAEIPRTKSAAGGHLEGNAPDVPLLRRSRAAPCHGRDRRADSCLDLRPALASRGPGLVCSGGPFRGGPFRPRRFPRGRCLTLRRLVCCVGRRHGREVDPPCRELRASSHLPAGRTRHSRVSLPPPHVLTGHVSSLLPY